MVHHVAVFGFNISVWDLERHKYFLSVLKFRLSNSDLPIKKFICCLSLNFCRIFLRHSHNYYHSVLQLRNFVDWNALFVCLFEVQKYYRCVLNQSKRKIIFGSLSKEKMFASCFEIRLLCKRNLFVWLLQERISPYFTIKFFYQMKLCVLFVLRTGECCNNV